MTLQQQIRQEMSDSLQRVCGEMHTAINGRLIAISSISSAMQRLSAGPAGACKPHRISDLIPKSWDGSHDKGQFRDFMAELHLWMQAWSDQGERILVRVESVDKVERSTVRVCFVCVFVCVCVACVCVCVCLCSCLRVCVKHNLSRHHTQQSRLTWLTFRHCQSFAQDDNKRTTEDGSASTGPERI